MLLVPHFLPNHLQPVIALAKQSPQIPLGTSRNPSRAAQNTNFGGRPAPYDITRRPLREYDLQNSSDAQLTPVPDISRPICIQTFVTMAGQDMPPRGGYEPVQYKVRGW